MECYNKCPFNAIQIKQDHEVFWRPEIIKDKCTNCGLCKKCSPAEEVLSNNSKNPSFFACACSDPILRKKSSSGGIFGLLANYVGEISRITNFTSNIFLRDIFMIVVPEYKDKNVCIASMWYGINYGSVLTSYALYKVVENLGYLPYLLNKPKQLWNDAFYNENSIANRFFENRANILAVCEEYIEHSKFNKYFDKFLVGCDTLWHFPLVKQVPTFFFLDFADKEKEKISYASSFGRGFEAPEFIRKRAKACLQSFKSVSVRENTAINLCNSLFNVIPTQVADPVFLLNKNDYDDISDASRTPNTKYIVSYILDPNEDKKNAILMYEKKFGVKCVNIVDPLREELIAKKLELDVIKNISVENWLHLFSNAEFVITDSFHGLCFSLIFKKQFICFGNKMRGLERFTSLLSQFNLTDRIFFDLNDLLLRGNNLKNIEYNAINNTFDNISSVSKNWLATSLSAKKKSSQITDSLRKDATIEALPKGACTGCGACAHICKENAISIKKNEDGFFSAVIDKKLCTNCGLCAKKCVALSPKYFNNPMPTCYAIAASDEIRKVSSSGGVFTLLAKYVLTEKKGYVCGAAYTDNFEVEHIIIDDIKDLPKIRGSKYIQSRVDIVFKKIKELLNQGDYVLFSGLPCQVAGLNAFLGKSYEHLITVDLFCHGITSSKVFKKYHQEVLNNKELVSLEFKAKKPWGWHAGTQATFTDGTSYKKRLEEDPYFKAYLTGFSVNSACRTCSQNALPRQGDFSIGDFWGVEKYKRTLNDNLGTSAVLVNNLKAYAVFNAINKSKDVKFNEQVPLIFAIAGNGSINIPLKVHKNRDNFFKYFEQNSFVNLLKASIENRFAEEEIISLKKKLSNEEVELYYLAKFVAKKANNRKIITWVRSKKFEDILNKYFNLQVYMGVTKDNNRVKNGYIEYFDIIKNKSSEYFLVSLDRAYEEALYFELNSFGFKEHQDFIFRRFKPITISDFDLSIRNYYDDFGNSIEGFSGIIKKFTIRGFNNHVFLGKNILGLSNLTLNLTANSFIQINEGVKFKDNAVVNCLGFDKNKEIYISNNCDFAGITEIRLWFNGYIRINKNCTFSSSVSLRANTGKSVVIGQDCMFSYDIKLQAGDGHNIYSSLDKTPINRNVIQKFSNKDLLAIGNHVWVGDGAFILNGSIVGDGSIVGAKSVVKGIYPNNCVLAGNPAKVVRTDIVWTRDGYSTALPSNFKCSHTKNANYPLSGRKVLVIGGTRINGKALVHKLLELGNKVTIANRGLSKDDFGWMVDRVTLDVKDNESVKKALSGKFFDVVFDNLAYCSDFANNILSNISCDKYIQLSSILTYSDWKKNISEESFNPFTYKLKMCSPSVGYREGKRQAECIAYQKFSHLNPVTVRIPYVVPTDRIYYYCKNVIQGIPMAISDMNYGFTLIRDIDIADFLPWIATQKYSGPINCSSQGFVTVHDILSYIESKTNKKAIIDIQSGEPEPFHSFNERTFFLNMSKASNLGYSSPALDDWIWEIMDAYINMAIRITK